jgi:hypothetical protein
MSKHDTNRAAAQDLQKEACKFYSTVTGVVWTSSRDDHGEIKPRQSGQSGTDVVLSSRVRELLISLGIPDCVECKNQKIWNLQSAILQARANTPKGSAWMLILKRRSATKAARIDPVVVMDLEVFTKMMEGLCQQQKS